MATEVKSDEGKNTKRTLTLVQEDGATPPSPLALLAGTWKNEPGLPGRGWNMIALPFAEGRFHYRLLLNQYNETLEFFTVDDNIPNRGIRRNGITMQTDQFVIALDYEQTIRQIEAADSPPSPHAGRSKLAIHHEPGLWLHMKNQVEDGLNIARLATIPHGNSVLALGRSRVVDGAPVIPDISGLPVGGVDPNVSNNPYLEPYKAFHLDKKFKGLFDPVTPNDLLKLANQGVNIVRTTTLEVDTEVPEGGISNIPFIVKQANATSMKSTFWIQELAEKDAYGDPKLRLQYSQTVMLDFFKRPDGKEGLIRWPHVSINTMEKVIS